MATTMVVDEERAKLITTLLKIGASKVPGDKVWTAEEVEQIFGPYDAAVQAELEAAEKEATAGGHEITAFANAATAIDPLSETMRLRVLRALDALMLPPPERKPLLPPELAQALVDIVPKLLETLTPSSPPAMRAVAVDPVAMPRRTDVPPGYTKMGTVARTPGGAVLLFGDKPEDVFVVPEELVRQVLAAFEDQRRRAAGEPIVTPPPKPDGES